MRRFRPVLAAVMLAGVCSLPLLGGPGSQGPATGEPVVVNPRGQAREEPPRPVLELRQKLSRAVNLPKGIDPNTPLKDALEFLGELHDVTILIDQAAFKAEGVGVVEPGNIAVGLPKVSGLSFRTVLHKLLSGMDPPATILHRYDHLVVVPRYFARPAAWGPAHRHLVPVVDIQFDRRPLEIALREVSEQTGINVVLDGRVGERGKTAISATFTQAAVDTAVYLLADMADLKAVALDNVLYVTTKANAEALTADLEKSGLKSRFQPAELLPTPGQ